METSSAVLPATGNPGSAELQTSSENRQNSDLTSKLTNKGNQNQALTTSSSVTKDLSSRKSPISEPETHTSSYRSSSHQLLSGGKRSSIVAHVPPFSRSIQAPLPATSESNNSESQSTDSEAPLKNSLRQSSSSSLSSGAETTERSASILRQSSSSSTTEGFSASTVAVSGPSPNYLPSDAISVFHSLVSSAIDQCLRNSSQSKVRVSVFSSLFDTVSRSSTQSNSPTLESQEAAGNLKMTSTQTRNNDSANVATSVLSIPGSRKNGTIQSSNSAAARWTADKNDSSNDAYQSPMASPNMLKIDEESSFNNANARDEVNKSKSLVEGLLENGGQKSTNSLSRQSSAVNKSDVKDDSVVAENTEKERAVTVKRISPNDAKKSDHQKLNEVNRSAVIKEGTKHSSAEGNINLASIQSPQAGEVSQGSRSREDKNGLEQETSSNNSSSDMVSHLTKYLLEQHLFNALPSTLAEKSGQVQAATELDSQTKASLMAEVFGDERQFASAIANATVAALASRQRLGVQEPPAAVVGGSGTTDALFSGPYSTPSPKLIGTPPPLTKDEPLNLSAPSPCSLSPTEQKIKIVVASENISSCEPTREVAVRTRSESLEGKDQDKNESGSGASVKLKDSLSESVDAAKISTMCSEDVVRGLLESKKTVVESGKFGSIIGNLSPQNENTLSGMHKSKSDPGCLRRNSNAFTKLCHSLIHSEVMKFSGSDCEHAIEKKINTSSLVSLNSTDSTLKEMKRPTDASAKHLPANLLSKDDSIIASKTDTLDTASSGQTAKSNGKTVRSLPVSPISELTSVKQSSMPTNEETLEFTNELLVSISNLCPSTKLNRSHVHSIVTSCMFNSKSFSALKLLNESLKEKLLEVVSPSSVSSATKRKIAELQPAVVMSPPSAKSIRLGGLRESPNTSSNGGSPIKYHTSSSQNSSPPGGKVGRPPLMHSYPEEPPRLLPYSHNEHQVSQQQQQQQQQSLAAAVASLTGTTPTAQETAHHLSHLSQQRALSASQLHAASSAMYPSQLHHSSPQHSDSVAAMHARLAATSDYSRNPLIRHPSQHPTPHSVASHVSATSPHAVAMAAATHAHHNSYLNNLQKSAAVAQAAALMKSQQQHALGHSSSTSALHHGSSGVHASPPGATGGPPGTAGPHHNPHPVADSMTAAAVAAQYHHNSAAEHLRLFPNYQGSHVPKLLQPSGVPNASQMASAAAQNTAGHRSPILAANSSLNKMPSQNPHYGAGNSVGTTGSHYPHASLAGANPTAHELESQLHHAAMGRFAAPPHLSASGTGMPPSNTDPTAAAILAFHHESQRKAAAAAINAAALQQQQHHPMPPSAAAAINAAAAHHYNQHRQQSANSSATGMQQSPQGPPGQHHGSATTVNSAAAAHALSSNHHNPYGIGSAVSAANHLVDNGGGVNTHSPISRQLRGGGNGGGVSTDADSSGPVSSHQNPVGSNMHSKPPGSHCANCGGEAIYLCSGCRKIWYCSQDCQVKAWERHYVDCFGSQGRQ